MNKNISTFLAAGALAQIPGKYFAADLGGTDLLGIVSAHPYIFWTALAIFIVACIALGLKQLARKKQT